MLCSVSFPIPNLKNCRLVVHKCKTYIFYIVPLLIFTNTFFFCDEFHEHWSLTVLLFYAYKNRWSNIYFLLSFFVFTRKNRDDNNSEGKVQKVAGEFFFLTNSFCWNKVENKNFSFFCFVSKKFSFFFVFNCRKKKNRQKIREKFKQKKWGTNAIRNTEIYSPILQRKKNFYYKQLFHITTSFSSHFHQENNFFFFFLYLAPLYKANNLLISTQAITWYGQFIC